MTLNIKTSVNHIINQVNQNIISSINHMNNQNIILKRLKTMLYKLNITNWITYIIKQITLYSIDINN